jgi:hypothetical protein
MAFMGESATVVSTKFTPENGLIERQRLLTGAVEEKVRIQSGHRLVTKLTDAPSGYRPKRVLTLPYEQSAPRRASRYRTSQRQANVPTQKFVRETAEEQSLGGAKDFCHPVMELIVRNHLRVVTAPVERHVHGRVKFAHGLTVN